MLLAHGARVDSTESNYGETALMWAAAENHPDAARLLIEHGAEVNARSTPLEYSKDRFGSEGAWRLIPALRGDRIALMGMALKRLKAGYSKGQAGRCSCRFHSDRDLDGTIALVLAIINAHYDTAADSCCWIKARIRTSSRDSAGMAALYAAVDMSTLGEVYGRPSRTFSDESDALDLMKALVRHGAKVNAQLRISAFLLAHILGDGNLGEGSTLADAGFRGTPMRSRCVSCWQDGLTLPPQKTGLLPGAGSGAKITALGVRFAGEYADGIVLAGGREGSRRGTRDCAKSPASDAGDTASALCGICVRRGGAGACRQRVYRTRRIGRDEPGFDMALPVWRGAGRW